MNIAWLRELNKDSIPVAGGKGAQLGEMYNSDFPVPPAFVVTAQAYKEFLSMNHLDYKIKNILNGLDVDNTKQLIQASDIIKEIIVNEGMSSSLKSEVIEAYNILNVNENVLSVSKNVLDLIKNGRGNAFVAVRSSATAEDLLEASFAGMQETFLNIKGEKNLIIAIKKCWASLFTPRAIFYRIKNNFPHEKVLIAVVVQKMINADRSGVLFTANPGTNNKNEIVIEAGFGLGEAIVSGAINPDLYILDKNSLKLKIKEIKKQKLKIIRDENTGETVRKNIPENEQGQQVLSESEIYKLGELGKKIDEHYGKPQDIEFAIEKSRIYIVQSRPVTTLKDEIKTEELKGEILTSGLSASPGVKSGIVKIIRTENEIDEFPEQGHVLVTTMTNPSMVPIMRKAVAIVTDEGGVTSHASIVSRELGIPCIVGSENATSVLEDGLIITVDANNGKVYKGEVKKEEQKSIEILDKGEGIETNTKIYMNLGEPEKISDYKDLNFDGIGLMRLEFIIAGEVGEHPNYLIKINEEEKYINELVKGIEKIARAINGKPIIVRFSDFKTNEYKDLKGGKEFEEHEDNPMIGFRGVSRYISDEFKESFKLECRAIKKVRETYRNVHVMLPFVRTVEEVEKCLEIMKEEKLERSDDFKIWLMAEVPSMAFISEDFAQLPIDGVSIGSNDLTMLCLGVDRDNEKLGRMGYFDERNKAVLVAIKNIIDGFKKYGKTTSLCGQSVSNYPEIAEFLVRNGITSVSVNPDVVGKVRREVAEIEKVI